MSDNNTVLQSPSVNEYQGIDLPRADKWLSNLDAPANSEAASVVIDLRELIEHVQADGLLQRVEVARRNQAQDDADCGHLLETV